MSKIGRAPATLLVTFLVLAGACTDDDDAAAPTSTAPSSTETTSMDACGTDEVRGAAVDVVVSADVDGDGLADEAFMTVIDESSVELVVDFAAGGRTVARYDDDTVFAVADVRVAAVADVDGDRADDLWIVVGQGASVEVISLVVGRGCDLVRPEADGAPNAFAVGASVGFTNGVECVDTSVADGVDVRIHEGENVGGSTYRGTSTDWVLEGNVLQRGQSEPFEVDAEAGGFARFAELTCI